MSAAGPSNANEQATASDQASNEDGDRDMPLVEHLIELRNRLLHTLIGILAVFVCLFSFSNEIYQFVSAPLVKFLPANSSMIATEVASTFITPFKLTLILSIFLAMPYMLYQLWSFIAPGLYRREKKLVVPLFLSTVGLFYCGIAFAYYVVFPLVFGFFTSVGPENVTVMTDISSYLDFVLKLFFAFGLAFEIPVATVLLIWTGLASPQTLASKRPYIVVACFVFGMLLTPPDMISQTLLALPMWLLFELGIFFGRWVDKAEVAEEP